MRHPDDGYIQPSDLTQALARGARDGGAEINRGVTVTAIERTRSGEWRVTTDAGTVTCEHVVSATGNFARQTGRMVGLDVPVIPVEHQYIVTEPHPEIQARHARGEPEMGVLRESDGSWYMREEAGGLLLGPVREGGTGVLCRRTGCRRRIRTVPGRPRAAGTAHRVGHEPGPGVCRSRREESLQRRHRLYARRQSDHRSGLGSAQLLVQRRPFVRHYRRRWRRLAVLAEWIVDGAPTIDMLGVDPRRFGPYATRNYLVEKNEEAYASVFTVHYPDEERPAARPLRTAPCYDRMKALGAVFHQRYGWERPNWFAPDGVEQTDHWSFRRSRWFEHSRNEAKNVMANVGLLDLTAFAKARISGPGAHDFLNGLVANQVPTRDGRIALCHALGQNGGVHSEFTLHREAENCYYAVSAGVYTRIDHDWIGKHLPADGSVRFDDLSTRLGTLVVAGPKSRELLQRVSADDFSNAGFKWLTGRDVCIGMAPVKAMRVNFIGELGWELHHPMEMQNHLFDILMAAGKDLGIKPFGIRAMEGMRIEKTYRMPGHELSIEYAALESGLERFVKFDKGDFLGRQALIDWQAQGFANQLVMLEVHDVEDADPVGNNPIYHDGELVGRATTGGYGFRLDRSLAIAMVRPELAAVGNELEMDILGRRHRVTIIPESPYDPDNKRLRDVA